jgi:hypothetical protein
MVAAWSAMRASIVYREFLGSNGMEEKEGGRFELQDLSSRACDPRPLHEGEREERPTNWEERTATPEISPTHHKEQTKGFVMGHFSRNAAKET